MNGYLRKMYKSLCALLCVTMLFGVFVGCSNGNTQQGSETTEDIAGTKQNTTLLLADNGKSEYSIYYAADLETGGSVAMLINTMATHINKATGAKLDVLSDTDYSDDVADTPAILIGKTKFAESAEASKKLSKIDDYHIGIVGNKLVICGGSADSCATALQYFMNNIIAVQRNKGKTLTFSSSDEYSYKATYGIDSVNILGTELYEYSLVVPKNAGVNETYFANTLRYWLMTEYGVLLDITNDTSAVGEHEIIIGSTSRVASAALGENEYRVTAADGRLELAANGYAAYDELYNYVTKTLIPSGESAKYTISESSVTVNAARSYEERTGCTLEGSGDVRVMYYNIYGWSGYNFDMRTKMQLELFATYAPDVIGCQEFTSQARAGYFYEGLRNLGYNEVPVNKGSSNYTPLFYDPQRLTVVESGWLLYDGLNDSNSKSVTWAVFETTAGKRFIGMSTHFYYTSDSAGNTARVSEAEQLLDVISDIRSNPDYADLPLIMGGDLNCRLGSAPLTVLSEGGLYSAWETAMEKNDLDGKHSHYNYDSTYGIYMSVQVPTDNYADSIDHAYVSEGVTVNSFKTLYNPYVMVASDHSPELVDISFS